MKEYLKIALIALVAVAVVARVPQANKIIFG